MTTAPPPVVPAQPIARAVAAASAPALSVGASISGAANARAASPRAASAPAMAPVPGRQASQVSNRPASGPTQVIAQRRPATGSIAAVRVHGQDDEAFRELVGFAAYLRLRLFVEVAQHVWGTPRLSDAQRLLDRSIHIAEQERALVKLGRDRWGLTPGQLMGPFDGSFDSFLLRTKPENWWEGLLRPLVVHGVSRDMIRLLSRGLPPADARVIQEIFADDDADYQVGVNLVRDAVASDQRLGARLSLWGRRVVAEAFGIGSELMKKFPPLGQLLVKATDDAAPGELNLKAAMHAGIHELTEDHKKRMELMGLVP